MFRHPHAHVCTDILALCDFVAVKTSRHDATEHQTNDTANASARLHFDLLFGNACILSFLYDGLDDGSQCLAGIAHALVVGCPFHIATENGSSVRSYA